MRFQILAPTCQLTIKQPIVKLLEYTIMLAKTETNEFLQASANDKILISKYAFLFYIIFLYF